MPPVTENRRSALPRGGAITSQTGRRRTPAGLLALAWLQLLLTGVSRAQDALPNTELLDWTGDLSARMVAGIDRFLAEQTKASATWRGTNWQRDFASREAYENSIRPNRDRFRRIIGADDPRVPEPVVEFLSDAFSSPVVAETESFTVYRVKWPVLEGVNGEGLWLRPKGETRARVVAVPDASQTPEMLAGLTPGVPEHSQFARRLVESGCEVMVPVLVDRQDTWSGNQTLGRFTNQPHREWIYRQAFELGRHIIGYEVQKVAAAAEFFGRLGEKSGREVRIGVAGYGEGALIAFYAAALEPKIEAAMVSGYFTRRDDLWSEPIYRNIFGLLTEFGDAEIATLIAPRPLIIEHSEVPGVDGPPPARAGRSGAAPGGLRTPAYEEVKLEFDRAREQLRGQDGTAFGSMTLITGPGGSTIAPGSGPAMDAFLGGLGCSGSPPAVGNSPALPGVEIQTEPRQRRQVAELENFTQTLLRRSEGVRDRFFWQRMSASTPGNWMQARAEFQRRFWDQVIGRLPSVSGPVTARSRRFLERPGVTGYEVVLDVYPGVFAWGYLLLPDNIDAPRPAVVCFHGLEGLPASVIDEDRSGSAYGYYKAFALRLAEQGFVVFAPHNPYRGGDAFRQLQRRANPLGKSLFSVILAQQERLLDWLETLPQVDRSRIGLYGLSYGGKTAMRVPALLDRYALSICSADFNEWVRKNATTEHPASYMYTGEYEMPEWNLGHTFNYAEMAALIAPRPFMVERGHDDGVAPDEWVAYEYAKVRRLYDRLGIGDRTEIEFFSGPHTIHGVGTYRFLQEHLAWPVK